MKPERIQRRRTKGWTLPPDTIVVDRSSGYGNPFSIAKATFLPTTAHPEKGEEWWVESDTSAWRFKTKPEAQKAAVDLFRVNAESEKNAGWRERMRLALRGKNLACWCKPGDPCHADVLLELANAPTSVSSGERTGEDHV